LGLVYLQADLRGIEGGARKAEVAYHFLSYNSVLFSRFCTSSINDGFIQKTLLLFAPDSSPFFLLSANFIQIALVG